MIKKLLATLLVAIGIFLLFPSGQEVFAQEGTTTVTVVGTVVSGGKKTPVATPTPIVVRGMVTSTVKSRVISTRFLGPEITDCPRLSVCPTVGQVLDALTFEGKLFGVEMTPSEDTALRLYLGTASVGQTDALWDLAPNLGVRIDGEEEIEIVKILSWNARRKDEQKLLKQIFGIVFPPPPAPTW